MIHKLLAQPGVAEHVHGSRGGLELVHASPELPRR
jgi:hypothetical protein